MFYINSLALFYEVLEHISTFVRLGEVRTVRVACDELCTFSHHLLRMVGDNQVCQTLG